MAVAAAAPPRLPAGCSSPSRIEGQASVAKTWTNCLCSFPRWLLLASSHAPLLAAMPPRLLLLCCCLLAFACLMVRHGCCRLLLLTLQLADPEGANRKGTGLGVHLPFHCSVVLLPLRCIALLCCCLCAALLCCVVESAHVHTSLPRALRPSWPSAGPCARRWGAVSSFAPSWGTAAVSPSLFPSPAASSSSFGASTLKPLFIASELLEYGLTGHLSVPAD